VWGQSPSPGNEQRDFWGSHAADDPGSRNYAGIKDPAVDALIEAVVRANTREDLVAAVGALDRVLLWSHYVVPHWHSGTWRVAYWNRLKRPQTMPPYGLVLDAWWIAGGAAPAAGGSAPK
jgi:microcin C transport system substrate-binding protein